MPLSTIDGWLRTGWVHGQYHAHILKSAWAEGIMMNELDFVAHLRGMSPSSVAAPERVAG